MLRCEGVKVFIDSTQDKTPQKTLNILTPSHLNIFTSIMKHQICLAVMLVIFGVVLISVAFFVPPTGVIDPTVLTAFGEILTFAGAIIGIDYRHRVKE